MRTRVKTKVPPRSDTLYLLWIGLWSSGHVFPSKVPRFQSIVSLSVYSVQNFSVPSQSRGVEDGRPHPTGFQEINDFDFPTMALWPRAGPARCAVSRVRALLRP